MLATARLKLRKFVPSDAPSVTAICGDQRVSSMCRGLPFPYTEADARHFVDEICTAMDGLILAIETLADGRLVGCIGLEEFRPGDCGTVADLSYWLAADAWGLGYATEAGSAMVDYAFESRGISALESGYSVDNTASARVQSKLGFSVVGSTNLHCAAQSATLEQSCTRLDRAAWQARKQAPKPPPVILRGLLDDADIRAVTHHARHRSASDGAGGVRYGDSHEAIFLHYCPPRARTRPKAITGEDAEEDGGELTMALPQACPKLFRRLSERVRENVARAGICDAASFDALSVRCIELHTYSAGGGLTEPGHCDQGSTVTLSVLLSEPGDGGVFSTTDASGKASSHPLGRGDAIALCSEMLHNVSVLRSGTRRSLVIEWWSRAANRADRFH